MFGFVVRMAFLATEDTTLMSKNMMDNHLGWTSIFGTSSGGNSVGSSDSEASVNQPAPDSPEPELPLRLISQMEVGPSFLSFPIT